MQIDKRKSAAVVGVLVVLLMTYILIINPAITGYSIYQNAQNSNHSVKEYTKEIGQLQNKLNIKNTNLSSCKSHNKQLMGLIKNFSERQSDCENRVYKLKKIINKSKENNKEKIKQFENKIAGLKERNSEQKKKFRDKLKNMRNNYTSLAENAAKNICCKKRVDNPDISQYRVQENGIVCVEKGGQELKCKLK